MLFVLQHASDELKQTRACRNLDLAGEIAADADDDTVRVLVDRWPDRATDRKDICELVLFDRLLMYPIYFEGKTSAKIVEAVIAHLNRRNHPCPTAQPQQMADEPETESEEERSDSDESDSELASQDSMSESHDGADLDADLDPDMLMMDFSDSGASSDSDADAMEDAPADSDTEQPAAKRRKMK